MQRLSNKRRSELAHWGTAWLPVANGKPGCPCGWLVEIVKVLGLRYLEYMHLTGVVWIRILPGAVCRLLPYIWNQVPVFLCPFGTLSDAPDLSVCERVLEYKSTAKV